MFVEFPVQFLGKVGFDWLFAELSGEFCGIGPDLCANSIGAFELSVDLEDIPVMKYFVRFRVVSSDTNN